MNKNERVLGRILATEELQLVAGGTTCPCDDETACTGDTTPGQDFTNGGLDNNFDDER